MNKLKLYLSIIKLMFMGQLEKEFYYLPRLLKKFTNKNSSAIDIGANIGIYSYLLSFYFRQVYSYEPINEMYLRCSNLRDNIISRNLALSDEKSEEIINIPIIDGQPIFGLSSMQNNFKESKQYQINVDKLDNFIDIDNIDFIKIDTEGLEDKVIKGAQKTILNNRPIIMVEIEQRHNIDSFDYITSIMKKLSYQGFYLNSSKLASINSFHFGVHQKIDTHGDCITPYYNNFFFIPNEKL